MAVVRVAHASQPPLGAVSTFVSVMSRHSCPARAVDYDSQTTGTAAASARGSSVVQWAQRVARSGITERQYGHSFVVGSEGAGVPPARFMIDWVNFTTLRNTTKATITKFSNSPKRWPTGKNQTCQF